MRKVRLLAMIFATILTVSVIPAYAGEWKQDTNGRWYQNDDGGFPTNCWQEIDGKQYYFGGDGYVLVNTTTPDGRQVGADGALIANRVYDNSSYQSILDWYSWKLSETTPQLIAEYKEEAKKNTSGLDGLVGIFDRETTKLAELLSEGIDEMANLYFKAGSGKYSEYQEWAGKLYDVYVKEAGKIYDVYVNSAM